MFAPPRPVHLLVSPIAMTGPEGPDRSHPPRPDDAPPSAGGGEEGPLATDPRAASPEAAREIARQLAGDLPCVRCRYNLRGLSVRGPCPECGLPVRATLLMVVDPRARELEPIPSPRLTAAGLLMWSGFALVAALLTWILRFSGSAAASTGGPSRAAEWAPPAATACILLSGIGALALVSPHGGIARRSVLWAAAGVAAYLPLAASYWYLHGVLDPASRPAYFHGAGPEPERSVLRLAIAALLILIILGLRLNARLLAARSFLLRTGRADRQTMAALAAAVGVGAIGDALYLLSGVTQGSVSDLAQLASIFLIALGSLLQTLGLAGIFFDCWRLAPVILEPPPTLRDLLARKPRARRSPPASPAPLSPPPPPAASRAGDGSASPP